MSVNQKHIRNLNIDTVANAATVGSVGDISYNLETGKMYKYVVDNSLTHDGLDVLTAFGTNGFWLNIGGATSINEIEKTICDTVVNYNTMPITASTTMSFTFPNSITWQDLVSTYKYIGFEAVSDFDSSYTRISTDFIFSGGGASVAKFGGAVRLIVPNTPFDLSGSVFNVEAPSGFDVTNFRITGIL